MTSLRFWVVQAIKGRDKNTSQMGLRGGQLPLVEGTWRYSQELVMTFCQKASNVSQSKNHWWLMVDIWINRINGYLNIYSIFPNNYRPWTLELLSDVYGKVLQPVLIVFLDMLAKSQWEWNISDNNQSLGTNANGYHPFHGTYLTISQF